MKFPKTNYSVLIDLAIIGGAWLSLLILFPLLGRAGYGTGLGIATMGEDQNWVALLQEKSPHQIANNFWRIDGRNPLSPWFYILARPLISFSTNGLALLQYMVGLLLAVATYALLKVVLDNGGRWFAVSASTIVAVNQANAYFDHIIWNFQLALCFTVLSILFYVLFLSTDRRSSTAYGTSLCFWCASFYTYTLQSGAIVAIAICQLFYLAKKVQQNNSMHEAPSLQLLKSHALVILDIVPYVVVFIVFLLTWATTTPTGGGFQYAFSIARFISSLQAAIFHEDIGLMFRVWQLSPFGLSYLVVAGFVAAALTVLIALTASTAPELPTVRYFGVILLIFAVALPTLIVESVGADWPPGSRWRMIYRVTTPVLILGIAGAITSLLRVRYRPLILAAISFCLLFGSLTFSLVYNERQVALSRSEAMVRSAMHAVITERQGVRDVQPILFLVAIDDSFQWLATESLRGTYMRSWFPGLPVEYRILASPRYIPSNPSRIVFDTLGVGMLSARERVPYERVVLLHASGKSVTRRLIISRQEVTSHNAEWQLPYETISLQ